MTILHKQLLQEKFGLSEFRHGQLEIISSVLQGADVLAVLPTGGGKSLCFQLPAVLNDGLVIVISPLIALMRDQVRSLNARGIAAGALHSGQSTDEKRRVFQDLAVGGAYLLYLSPERTQKEAFHRWLQNRKITLIAVDEAHCVSQWGHDFRIEYAQLKTLKALRPDVPMLALTASATPLVLTDIAKHLGLRNPAKHVYGFYRPNLYYQVESCVDQDRKLAFVEQALTQTPSGRVIIYCGTRKLTEAVSQVLKKKFAGVAYYHAGLSPEDRNDIQHDYNSGAARILVSTNAFGMGIDHPDVRLVIHFNMPANIDSLYQEMGRAGRDDAHSTCLLLFEKKDKSLQSYFIQSSEAPADIKRSRWNNLDAILDYAESGECRHAGILTYYQDAQRLKKCGHCDACDPKSVRKIAQPPLAEIAHTALVTHSGQIVKKRSKSKFSEAPLDSMEQIRFELLREWRKKTADEFDIPAFVVFSDRSLKEIARVNPAKISDLKKIHGFGETKLERFGRDVLNVLGQ